MEKSCQATARLEEKEAFPKKPAGKRLPLQDGRICVMRRHDKHVAVDLEKLGCYKIQGGFKWLLEDNRDIRMGGRPDIVL